jgi:two-component system OmpR family sensor kinase
MNRRPARRWLLACLPLGLGLVAASLNPGGRLNPLLYVRADLRALALILGMSLSLMMGIWGGWQTVKRRQAQALSQAQSQANEDRRRFLQRLDHELKNPLMAIRAGLANLADAPTSTARAQALASVEAQTVRLSRLTADLRKIAELETRDLERSEIDLNHLLEEAICLAKDRPGAAARRLTLTVPQAPWPLPIISGDRDLILVSIYNLLENALKFTGPDETIEVRAREEGQQVVIEVADTGPGIAASDLPHVWEELYRGQSARGVSGSGLGLALVKAVAERHGGSVALRSRAGKGTIVSMRLTIHE